MKFIRDLIEEKSKSIQQQADAEPKEAVFQEPLPEPPMPKQDEAVPVGPIPGASAKMEPFEDDIEPETEDTFNEGPQLDLNDLRRALANSDEEVSVDVYEDEMEFSDTADEIETPQPDEVEPEEIEAEQPAEMEQPSMPVEDQSPEEPADDVAEPMPTPLAIPSSAAGRANRQSGRVKTRILGFSSPNAADADPFAKAGETASAQVSKFPVGWLAVVDGPGRGAAFTIFDGVAQIGRGEDQAIRLDFGDSSISRQNHAAVAYDHEQKRFFLGHGGKTNLVRLNGKPVLSTEELSTDDTVRIGETTLRFIALCGPNFSWDQQEQEDEARNASVG